LRDALSGLGPRLFAALSRGAKSRVSDQELWALKDVSFDVTQGEVVGVIGRNGAGKSTLLKVLSRITEPTEGTIRLKGRVGALLEVGTGFHPELTGRENIFLAGAILGMSRWEIRSKFDEIVAFSEVEKFLDTPVKRYSSGMYVRLAFAVAAHLEPEILVIDEVLAVGDTAFQRKCLGRMGEAAQSGRTVIFVSHNLEAVTSLCGRAVLLDQGSVVTLGDTAGVISRYLASVRSEMALRGAVYRAKPDESKDGQIISVHVGDIEGRSKTVHDLLSPISVSCEFVLRRDYDNLVVSAHVRRSDGYSVCSTCDPDYLNFSGGKLCDQFPKSSGRYRARTVFPAPLLNTGLYEISCHLSIPRYGAVDSGESITIEVVEADGGSYASYPFKSRRECLLVPPIPWTVERVPGRE
jgi:lipopolysaccharide transport system ATP-binding protein